MENLKKDPLIVWKKKSWIIKARKSLKHLWKNNFKMLGRKQSIKAENILADYRNEEMMNESADVEWVNKVSSKNTIILQKFHWICFSFGSGVWWGSAL